MPEGHTIHRLARFLRKDLAGSRVGSTALQERFAAAAERFDGEVLDGTDAHGKHLFVHFGDETVHVHLGLFGRFRRRSNPAPEPRGALRWRLEGDERTWDLSGPTACDVLDPEQVDAIRARLGPDPLRRDADPEAYVRRAGRSRRPIGDLLLDQKVVAGIGNVYRAELCFLHGVHPSVPGNELDETVHADLWDSTVDLLRIGERLGRIVTTDPDEVGVSAPGRIPRRERLYVYKRPDCRRCGTEIEVFELANRTCYACPTCQPRR
ncbi:MAG: DNA-formamidopyrimidine glycosylase family protein [Actinomycetota bacterium]